MKNPAGNVENPRGVRLGHTTTTGGGTWNSRMINCGKCGPSTARPRVPKKLNLDGLWSDRRKITSKQVGRRAAMNLARRVGGLCLIQVLAVALPVSALDYPLTDTAVRS